jgi:hypothetical protein
MNGGREESLVWNKILFFETFVTYGGRIPISPNVCREEMNLVLLDCGRTQVYHSATKNGFINAAVLYGFCVGTFL